MRIAKHARRAARQLFRSCLVGAVPDEGRVRETVQALAQQRPRAYLQILSHFHHLLKLDAQCRTARVESPVPLSPAQRAGVTANLKTLYGAGLSFTFAENPALLGGLRIKVGSDVYDGTIRGRLARLAASL